MDITRLKAEAVRIIEEHKEEIIKIGRKLYTMPESGYREQKTSAYMKKVLESTGLSVRDGIAITGLKAIAKGRKSLANVGFCGELDSLIMPGHSTANPETGAAHICGHHSQLTAAAGVAIGLVQSGLINELDGDLTFLVVPAEEMIELEYRADLVKQGKIKYLGGKQEFIHLGEIDDVDCIIGCHNFPKPGAYFNFGSNYNGLIAKSIKFIGKSAHGAKNPELAINALHAAVCAINNINALREGFRDDDHIRVHYIITKGGDSVNIIPDDVRLEMCVRGFTAHAMKEANLKVNIAIRTGAAAIGAQVEIEDCGAYLPFVQNKEMSLLFGANAVEVAGEENVESKIDTISASSTDAGDFSSVKPTCLPYFGGSRGVLHTTSYDVANDYILYVQPAKAFAMTIIDLLYNNARKAIEIKENNTPLFKSRTEYEVFLDELLNQ